MNHAFETYRNTKIFSSLDGMRCFSIAYVIWHHSQLAQFSLWPIFQRGFLGVDLFFVISGFLIVTLLLRENDKTGTLSLKHFYARRTLRIFPVYYALLMTISLFILIFRPTATMREPFFNDLPYYALYISNWHHNATFMSISWSLATEEQFYLVWPFIQKYLRAVALAILLVFVMINQAVNFGALTYFLGSENIQPFISLEIVQCTFTPICLGIFAAYLLHREKSYQCLYAWGFGKKWAPLVFVLGLLVLLNYPGHDIQGPLRLLIQAMSALLIITVVIREDHILRPLLTVPLIKRMGIVSYGMYLFHLIIMGAVLYFLKKMGFLHNMPLFILTLFGTYFFSELSYRYFETPFLNLKNKFK